MICNWSWLYIRILILLSTHTSQGGKSRSRVAAKRTHNDEIKKDINDENLENNKLKTGLAIEQEFDLIWQQFAIPPKFKAKYYEKIEEKGYNSVSLFKYFTSDILQKDIGMNVIHCQAFLDIIEPFLEKEWQ